MDNTSWFLRTSRLKMVLFVIHVLLVSACLAENIAFLKPAYQTGQFGRATADKAVDGRYDSDTGGVDYLNVCAFPDAYLLGRKPAQWSVDLEATYSISTVTVWNTYNVIAYRRMNNFTVEVVTSDNKTIQSCGVYRQAEPVSRGGSYTFNCNNKQGRYVYVRRLEGFTFQHLLTLCEVEVDGYLTAAKTSTAKIPLPDSTARTAVKTSTTNVPLPASTVRTEVLAWALSGLACAVIITVILGIRYAFARKQPSHQNQRPNLAVDTALEQTELSAVGYSAVVTTHQRQGSSLNPDPTDYEELDGSQMASREPERLNDNTESTQMYLTF